MIEAIKAEMGNLSLGRLGLVAVSLLPFLLGWLVGFVVRAFLWIVAAVVAGFKAGRG